MEWVVSDSYFSLMVEHGGSSAGSYLADPTSPIPSHWFWYMYTCWYLRSSTCTKTQVGPYGLVDKSVRLKINTSGVRFSLFVKCRNVGQTSHSIMSLPTQPWRVPGGWKLCLCGSKLPAYLYNICCILLREMRLLHMWVSYTRETNDWLNMVEISDLKLCTFSPSPFTTIPVCCNNIAVCITYIFNLPTHPVPAAYTPYCTINLLVMVVSLYWVKHNVHSPCCISFIIFMRHF